MAIKFEFTGESSSLDRTLKDVTRGMDDVKTKTDAASFSIKDMMKQTAAFAGLSIGAAGLKSFVSQIASVRGEYQKLEVAFDTMLGNKSKADALMAQMVQTAATTPFSLNEVANGAKQLLAYNLEADKVNDTLVRLGNIASGLSIPLNDIVYLYGTTMAQGRLYTQDLNQFTGRGIPMISELAKQFGVAESEVKSLVEAGKVGFPEVQKVIMSLTNEGGKFAGLMEAQSKTIAGQISNIADGIEQMFNNIGRQNEGIISDTLSGVGKIVDNYETVGRCIMDLVVVYGSYKAAVMFLSSAQTAAAKSVIADLHEEMAVVAGREELMQRENALMLETQVTEGRLTEEQAKRIAALNEETYAIEKKNEAEINSLAKSGQITEQQALELKQINSMSAERQVLVEVERTSADNALKNAQKRIAAAQKESDILGSEQEMFERLIAENENLGNAEMQNYYTAKLQENMSKQRAVANELEAATTAEKTAQEQLNTATLNANTVAMQQNHISQVISIKNMGLMRAAGVQLTKVLQGMAAAIDANPLAIVVAAAVTAAYGIYKLVTYESDLEKQTKKLTEATGKYRSEVATERHEIDSSFNSLKNAKEGTEEYQRAKDDIISKYGKYLQGMNDEISTLKDVQGAYEAVAKAAAEAARQRGLEAALGEANDAYGKSYADNMGKLQNALLKRGDETETNQLLQDVAEQLRTVGQVSDETKAKIGEMLKGDFSFGESQTWIKSLENGEKNLKQAIQRAEALFPKAQTQEPQQEEQKATLYVDEANKAMTAWKTAKAQYDAIQKDNKASTAEVKKAQEDLQKAADDYKKLTGKEADAVYKEIIKSGKDAAKQAAEMADIQRKVARDRERSAKQIELETEQARIDAMAESGEKAVAQIRLNFEKELVEIENWYDDLKEKRIQQERELWEAQNPDKQWTTEQQQDAEKRAEFGKDSPERKAYDARVTAARAALDEIARSERQHMAEYLREYGNLQQQKEAISMQYDEKIAKAGDIWEKKSLQKQKENALSDLDVATQMSGITGRPDFLEAMIDPSRVSIDNLKQLNGLLEDARDALSNLPPDQLEVITGLMERIDAQIIDRNPFEQLRNSYDELEKARGEKTVAGNELQREQLTLNMLKAQKAPLEQIEAAEKRVADAKNKYTNATNKEIATENRAKASKAKIADAISDLGSAFQQVAGQLDAFGGNSGKYISTIGSVVSAVSAGLTASSSTAVGAMKAIESATAILAIISAAIQLATMAADLLGLSKDDSAYNKAKDEYNALVSTWDTLIDKKKEYLAISWGSEIQAAGNEAQQMARASIEAARQMAAERRGAGASAGSHSYGVRMDRNLRDYFSQVGITSISQLERMSGEQLERIREQNAVFWAKLDSDYRGYLEDIIEGYNAIDDLEDAIKEQFTQMTFQGMYDSFVDTLMDMDATSQNFADNVSEYFMRAILSNQIGTQYRDKLNEWYDDLAADLQANGGTLTDAQTEALQQRYMAIVDGAIQMRDQIAEATGYIDSTAARGSSGVSSSVSQETMDEANGRMAALQIGQQTMIAQGIQLVNGQDRQNGLLNDILTGNALRNGYLTDIIERMNRMEQSFFEQLQSINTNTKNI